MTRSRALSIAAVALLSASAVLAQPEPPLHEKETVAGWEAYKRGKFAVAIKHADNCILEFHGAAGRRQKELADKKEVVPNGRVTPAQKTAIYSNGPLNDVATSYYIKARATAKLGRKAEAAKALAEAVKYPDARCWDDRGWFWSPAEAAEVFRTNPELADKAVHEALVALAWNALNRRDHAKAAEYADKCVARFHAAAQEMEQDLAKRNVRVPTGAVDERTKAAIFENGVLNDTGTALFIKGKAAEGRGDKKAAVAAYGDAVKLPRARCWDPRGWFWSPAEAAQDRLDFIQ
jgi:tetratricopeptide (TPR) repeat protein